MPSERDLIQQIQSHVTRLVQAVADAEFWHDRWLELAEREHQQRTSAAEAGHQQAHAEAQSTYEQQVRQATQEHEHQVAQAQARYQQALSKAGNEYAPAISSVFQDAEALNQSVGLLSTPWHDPVWGSWAPVTDGDLPRFIRIGELLETGQWDRLTLPALLPLVSGHNVLLKAAGPAKPIAVHAIQSVLLRLAATIPPGKLRFTFIDPVGLGQNVAAFMHLADYDENLVTNRAWTEPHHIEQRLANLTEHMETVIQTYLRNQYATIEEYNDQAGEIAEPYRVLVALDFPVNFSETAARRLVSIAQNGPRCGVYAVVLADTEKPLPHGFNLADLERASTVIAWNGERFIYEDDDFRDCLLELDTPPDAALFNHILTAVGVGGRAIERERGSAGVTTRPARPLGLSLGTSLDCPIQGDGQGISAISLF